MVSSSALLLILSVALAGDDPFGWDASADSAPSASLDPWSKASAEQGGRLFRSLCVGCHGEKGDGRSAVAPWMVPAPRDLVRADYRLRSTPSGALPTRDDLLRTLRQGLPATPMPAWAPLLDDGELRSLVVYVMGLSPRFEAETGASADQILDVAALSPPPVTPELVARGRVLYGEMKCGDCHGATGRGDGPSASGLKTSDGQPSRVFDFTGGVYKSGSERADLYRTFSTGMDGTPMPSYAASLPDEADRWALAAYCGSLSDGVDVWDYLSRLPGRAR